MVNYSIMDELTAILGMQVVLLVIVVVFATVSNYYSGKLVKKVESLAAYLDVMMQHQCRMAENLDLLAALWTWWCKHCSHINRGTDSSLLCEACGTPRG